MRTPIGGWILLPMLGAAAMLGGCSERAGADLSPARANRQQCFLPQQVNGFNAENDQRVFVTVGTRTVYQLDIVGVCPEVDWSQRIGIRSRGGGSWVCQGLDAELIVPSPTGVQTCPVTGVRQLSPEEVRAYRERRRG